MTKTEPIREAETRAASPPMPPRRVALVALIFLVIPALGTLLSGRRPELSDVDTLVVVAAAIGIMVRVGIGWRRGLRALPLVDLPVLGLVFVATGGADSPFDPALFLVYSLLALFLEREPRQLASLRFATLYGVGVVAMYALLLAFVSRDQQAALDRERESLLSAAAAPELAIPKVDLRGEGLDAAISVTLRRLRDEGQLLESDSYFDPSASSAGFRRDIAAWTRALEERQSSLERARESLVPDAEFDTVFRSEQGLTESLGATRQVIDSLRSGWRDALERASSERSPTVLSPDPLTAIAVESALAESGLRRLEEIENAQDRTGAALAKFALGELAGYKRMELDFAASRRSLMIERTSLAILAFATLVLVAGLRAHYEDDVRRREAARVARDLQRKQQETDNWIALTAGYTHTIGNDILAYDAMTEEALDEIAARDGVASKVVIDNLRFIRASNKQRVGFIRFLEEFARMRKQRLEGRPFEPTALSAIDVEKLLREERAHVGAVEVLDLPPANADPRAARLRAKFADLPLEIRFTPDQPATRVITKGRTAVLQFFAYELLKNALRNCSGDEPLRVEVEKRRDRVLLRFVNDLEVATSPDPSAEGGVARRLPRLPERVARSERELGAIVADVLAHCFEPHVGGGTGLGLFLIRYFVAEYYCGSISARVLDAATREVAFELDVPDDLAHASRDSTETA